ncbi:lysophospholipase [Yarrowia lipolytica]|nr:lysophospholipase [Yarrowia lipolytica]KAJ8053253.1 lysophospholipase [Yarrowia lipolytica]
MTKCPPGTLLRQGGNISSSEAAYIAAKDCTSNLALGFSGGDYRSMIVSAGVVKAFDHRNLDSTTLGGLLQSINYMPSASGGSWTLGTLVMNNFPQINASSGTSLLSPLSWTVLGDYGKAITKVVGKRLAGYRVSLTDEFGLVVGEGLAAGGYHTFSDISQSYAYVSHDMPFPVCLVTALPKGDMPATDIINSNPILEATPVEFGSYDKQTNMLMSIGQIGSQMENGQVQGDCTAGFDQGSFFMGASASLFNSPTWWTKTGLKIVGLDNGNQRPSGIFHPNPFKGLSDVEAPYNGMALYGADGAYSGMGLPLWPMVHPSRKVDMFFCLDADGAPPNNTPDGKTLTNLANKVSEEMGEGVFPLVPSPHEYQAKYLEKPLWMGCDVTKMRKIPESNRYVPLFVEIPNLEVSYNSLVKTMKLDYSKEDIDGIVQTGFDIATMSNSTEWAQCIGCSVVLREFQRQNKTVPECMDEYCYS